MASRPPPTALLPWAETVLGCTPGSTGPLTAVAGDASSRRYFRAQLAGASRVLVEAPPATEKNAAFLAVAGLMSAAGVRVPRVYAADLAQGFLLLEDLGDAQLLPALDEATAGDWYARCFAILERLALAGLPVELLPAYDRELLLEELGRFPQWFVGGLLGHATGADEQALLADLATLLVDSALAQPRVLVHRDFHARNLMRVEGDLAVIDFQDAVRGPVTYDLVSLLRDCYIRWDPLRVGQWCEDYRQRLAARGLLPGVSAAQFRRWFDLMGLQRHIKVLGTFARLCLRDGKAAYLDDLPLVLRYVREVAAAYREEPVIARFDDWFTGELAPRIASQPWGDGG